MRIDTPRTDDIDVYLCPLYTLETIKTVDIDFARKLERELAEAKHEAESVSNALDTAICYRDQLRIDLAAAIARAEKAERERDELRKALQAMTHGCWDGSFDTANNAVQLVIERARVALANTEPPAPITENLLPPKQP